MARKFRRTRRKRGRGSSETDEEYRQRIAGMCGSVHSQIQTKINQIDNKKTLGESTFDLEQELDKLKKTLDWCNNNYFKKSSGGRKSRRKRRKSKKRKSRKRKKRSRRRKRKKR